MRRDALIASGCLHLAVFALALFGLPSLFRPDPVEDTGPVAVEVVTLDKDTPSPAAKPEPAKPQPKPPPAERAPPPPPPPAPEAVKVPPPPKPVPEAAKVPPPPKPAPKAVEAPAPRPAAAPPKPEPVKAAKVPPRPKHKPKPPPPSLASLLKDIRKDLKPAPAVPEKTPAKDKPDPQKLARELVAGLKPASPDAPPPSTLVRHEASLIAEKVRAQITPCWAVPAGAKDAQDMRIGIRIALNPDGTLRGAPSIADRSRMNDPVFRAFAESALRAIQNPRCSPLRLPTDRYDVWSDMTIVFDPRELVGP